MLRPRRNQFDKPDAAGRRLRVTRSRATLLYSVVAAALLGLGYGLGRSTGSPHSVDSSETASRSGPALSVPIGDEVTKADAIESPPDDPTTTRMTAEPRPDDQKPSRTRGRRPTVHERILARRELDARLSEWVSSGQPHEAIEDQLLRAADLLEEDRNLGAYSKALAKLHRDDRREWDRVRRLFSSGELSGQQMRAVAGSFGYGTAYEVLDLASLAEDYLVVFLDTTDVDLRYLLLGQAIDWKATAVASSMVVTCLSDAQRGATEPTLLETAAFGIEMIGAQHQTLTSAGRESPWDPDALSRSLLDTTTRLIHALSERELTAVRLAARHDSRLRREVRELVHRRRPDLEEHLPEGWGT